MNKNEKKILELFEWWESDLNIEIELQKNKEKILIIFYSDTYYSNNQRHYESLRNLEVIDIKKDELIDSERFISKKDAIDYIFSNYLDEKWKLI